MAAGESESDLLASPFPQRSTSLISVILLGGKLSGKLKLTARCLTPTHSKTQQFPLRFWFGEGKLLEIGMEGCTAGLSRGLSF